MSAPEVARADATDVEGIEKKVAQAKAEVAEAKKEVAQAKKEVAEAKKEVGKAETKVDKAKEQVEKAGTNIELKATADLLLKVALEGLQTAQDGVKSAQDGVKSAQDGVKSAQAVLDDANDGLIAANKLARQASQRLPDTTSGGADASQTSDDLSATLQEIRARLGVIEEGQMTLEHKLDFFTPVDPWELLSSNSSQSQTGNLRQNLKALYHPMGAQIMCVVSKVVDNDTQDGGERKRVVAAHLWPKSKASYFATWKSRRSQVTACQDINDAANGLFLLHDIEQAFDRKQVCFICDPFKVELLFLVLDPDLLVQDRCPKGCATTWLALHKTRITEIEMNKRPAFQILSHHASLSVDAAFQKGWLTDEQKVALQASIKVTSPSTSAA